MADSKGTAAMLEGLAGAVASMISMTATYPLLALMTRQQAGVEGRGSKHSLLNNLLRLLRLARNLDIKAFKSMYHGIYSALVAQCISFGTYYAAASFIRAWFVRGRLRDPGASPGKLGSSRALMIATLAGAVCVLLTNPFWLVVSRMQVEQTNVEKKRRSAKDIVRDVIETDGVFGFWKGVGPSLLMVANPAVQMSVMESFLRLGRTGSLNKDPSNLRMLLAGAVGKIVATLATYPMQVVKSQHHVGNCSNTTCRSKPEKQQKSILATLQSIYKRNGIGGLYNGLALKAGQSVTNTAILVLVQRELGQFLAKTFMGRPHSDVPV